LTPDVRHVSLRLLTRFSETDSHPQRAATKPWCVAQRRANAPSEVEGKTEMTRKRLRFLVPLFATGLVVTTAACQADEDGGDTSGSGEFPRNETLYTTGTEWGTYSNYNPTQGGGQATGVRGLLYETLYVFDPHTAQLEPWLANSGDWVSDNEYELTLREGIEWQDGEPLTAEDVVFTADLRFNDAVPFSTMTDWLDTAEAVDDECLTVP
jgi:peptide/nickel transport system substrate-binding protein